MGHEIIVFGNRHERFDITPLAIAFSLLSRWGTEWIDRDRPGDPAKEWFKEWQQQLRATTTFFDPDLDALITTNRSRDTLIEAIKTTLSRLNEYGTEISPEALQDILPNGAIFERPYPVSALALVLGKIQELLLSKPLDR